MKPYGSFAVHGPLTYTATMTALEAIQRAAVQCELAAANQPDTILGLPVAFTGDGELQDAEFYILQVQDSGSKRCGPER